MVNSFKPPIPEWLCRPDSGIGQIEKLASKLPNLKNIQCQWKSLHQWKLQFVAQKVKEREDCELKIKKQINYYESTIETSKTEQKVISEAMQANSRHSQDTTSQIEQAREDIAKLELEKGRLEKAVESKRIVLRDKQIAFGKGIDFFKRRLQCYLQIEKSSPGECTFVLYFFTSEKPGSKPDNFVKLNRNGDDWELLETKPQLSNQAALTKKLAESRDIQGFLCHVQKQFREIKSGN